jgi:hypothetical protein
LREVGTLKVQGSVLFAGRLIVWYEHEKVLTISPALHRVELDLIKKNELIFANACTL